MTVQITPSMAAAGAAVLVNMEDIHVTYERLASDIYEAMFAIEPFAITDKMVEAGARAIDPRSWEVMDGYLAQMKRKYAGVNASYDPDEFKHKESMNLVRAVLVAVLNAQEPNS